MSQLFLVHAFRAGLDVRCVIARTCQLQSSILFALKPWQADEDPSDDYQEDKFTFRYDEAEKTQSRKELYVRSLANARHQEL